VEDQVSGIPFPFEPIIRTLDSNQSKGANGFTFGPRRWSARKAPELNAKGLNSLFGPLTGNRQNYQFCTICGDRAKRFGGQKNLLPGLTKSRIWFQILPGVEFEGKYRVWGLNLLHFLTRGKKLGPAEQRICFPLFGDNCPGF